MISCRTETLGKESQLDGGGVVKVYASSVRLDCIMLLSVFSH